MFFRFAFLAFAFFALGALLFGGAGGAAAAAGGFAFAGAFFAFKLLFLVLFIGFIASVWRRGPRSGSPWHHGRPGDDTTQRPSRREQFEEWHRLAHAREEVDSWVDGIE